MTNNEKRAHDLTILFLNKSIDSSKFNSKNDLEINIIENYLKYNKIILDQLNESQDD